ncbi:MAG: purine-nucleoside phosphorylase [Marinifilaceae bacterium]|jgi:purine-nucleoside phosphorylase|nr:purine-nucleoside phosphorylase [Marinifilaceae bacterium]
MTAHNNAQKGQIAETILLPGDPLRAKYIADNYLTDATCYNTVRNMYGYTGLYKGNRISVQGTGMGIPSISIYANELINIYGVKNLIRIGSCGSFNSEVKVRDIIIAQTACTDSAINTNIFNSKSFAPCADFDLLLRAYNTGKELKLNMKVGNVLTSDVFYHDPELESNVFDIWQKYGVLAVEMETSALYSLANRYGAKALSILTVSDHILTGEQTSAEEREKSFNDMMELSLNSFCL